MLWLCPAETYKMPKQKPDKNQKRFHGNQYTKRFSKGTEVEVHYDGEKDRLTENHTPPGTSKGVEFSSKMGTSSSPSVGSAEEQDASIRAKRRKRLPVLPDGHSVCSVCGLTVRGQDLEAHLQSEIDQLEKLTKEGSENMRYRFKRRNSKYEELVDMESSDRYEEYLRIKRKRETRLRKMQRDWDENDVTQRPSGSGACCPVCQIPLTGTPMERNRHAEICLNKLSGGLSPDNEDEQQTIDIEGDEAEEYEEYTWCGETRIRATTLVEGGLQGLGYKTVSSSHDDNQDVELDVEGDDTAIYGAPQYCESDIIEVHSPDSGQDGDTDRGGGTETNNNNNGDEPYTGPQAPGHSNSVVVNGSAIQRTFDPVSLAGDFYSEDCPTLVIKNEDYGCMEVDKCNCSSSCSHSVIIENLKKRIKELESHETQSPIRCLICLDSFRKPVVSIQCWHVYCEDCWMKTLGHKRLCPQCQMITSPGQLRQIYL